ncbi:hypothetical protein B0O99DRAFT_702036 [Bisporella sp. PMI_857]|nr:hypothetical protein B0O99DRAFT_702036 [Bisporella sp. PMI_857]
MGGLGDIIILAGAGYCTNFRLINWPTASIRSTPSSYSNTEYLMLGRVVTPRMGRTWGICMISKISASLAGDNVAVQNIIGLPLSFNTAPASFILGRKSGRLCNTVWHSSMTIRSNCPKPSIDSNIGQIWSPPRIRAGRIQSGPCGRTGWHPT